MRNHTRMLILCALFAALTAVGAFLRLPAGAMSITLQFFFTAMAALLLGPRWGALSQIVYVALGLAGLPVFTQGGGPGYVFQPSFGFLLGLIPAAWVMGKLAGDGTRPWRTALACAAGDGVLYLVGIPYMYLIFNGYLGRGMSLSAVLWAGMLVYLPGDAVKIAAAALLAKPLLRPPPRQPAQYPPPLSHIHQ